MKRSLEIRWAEVRGGMLLLCALALLALGILTVGERTRLFTPQSLVRVVLTNVQGLKIGAPVWLSGVGIGTVSAIAFQDGAGSDEIVVTLSLDASAVQRLGPDVRISIKTRGLLGEKYVDIIPGVLNGKLPDEPLRGVPTISFDEVISKAYDSFDRFGQLSDALVNREGTLGKFLQDPALYDNLVGLSGRLKDLLREASQGDGSLARIINDPDLYQRLTAFTAQGEEAATSLKDLAESLKNPDGTLGRLASDPQLYETALTTVEQAARSLREFEQLATRIQGEEGTLGRLINDHELHDRMLKSLTELDSVLRDIRENPGRYVKISVF